MSIVRLYRDQTGEDGTRRFEYREAWFDADAAEFVVHHGRVGAVGTVGEQKVKDEAEGEELLAAFATQSAEEGFAELEDSALTILSVVYRLRGKEISGIERKLGDLLSTEITHQLAWRGLGDVVDTTEQDGRLVLTVRTPHAGKAETEVLVAAKHADGIQPNKVEVHRGDLRGPAAAADVATTGAETTAAAPSAETPEA